MAKLIQIAIVQYTANTHCGIFGLDEDGRLWYRRMEDEEWTLDPLPPSNSNYAKSSLSWDEHDEIFFT